jgi:membrane protein required for colicin V production
MNGIDYLILGILVLSVVLGVLRGFVREAVALLAWLCGVWLAWRFAPLLEPHLGGKLGEPPVSTWAARVLILMAVLVFGWFLAGVLSYVLRHSALSVMVDRLLGMVFGVLRGAVVIAAFVLLGKFAELDQVKWWKESRLMPYASDFAEWIQAFAETGMRELDRQAQASQANLLAQSPTRSSPAQISPAQISPAVGAQ